MITKPSALTRTTHAEIEGQDTSNTSILSLCRGMGGAGEGSSQNKRGTSSLDYSFVLTGDSQSASSTRSLAYMGGITGDSQSTSSTRSLAYMGSITGDSQSTSGTRSLDYMGSIIGDGQSTSGTRSLDYMESIFDDSQNTSRTSSLAYNRVLAEVGQNTSYTSILTANFGIGNSIANTMAMSSSSNLGLGSNMSNMLVSSSMSKLGLGSNMNNMAVSLGLTGDGQGSSGTSSLRSNISNLNFSRQIVGRGQNTRGTSRLNFSDRTGGNSGDMTRGVGRASGLKRDTYTARGFIAFSPWNQAGFEKSLLQINLGYDAIALMDVVHLGALTNFSYGEFYFSGNYDQRYHFEKQPHFLDEVASNVFPSVYAGNSVPENADLDRLKGPLFVSPLHQNKLVMIRELKEERNFHSVLGRYR